MDSILGSVPVLPLTLGLLVYSLFMRVDCSVCVTLALIILYMSLTVGVYRQACSGIPLVVGLVGRDRRLWNSMVQGTQKFSFHVVGKILVEIIRIVVVKVETLCEIVLMSMDFGDANHEDFTAKILNFLVLFA